MVASPDSIELPAAPLQRTAWRALRPVAAASPGNDDALDLDRARNRVAVSSERFAMSVPLRRLAQQKATAPQ